MASVKDKERIKGVSAVGSAPQVPEVVTTDQPEAVKGEVVDIIADIDKGLQEYQVKYGIDDLCSISQGRWNGGLLFVYNNYIKPIVSYLYLGDNKFPDGYNTDVLYDVCNYYINLCHVYDKQISIMGFSYLVGVDKDVIIGWGDEKYKKATYTAKAIYKKLYQGNEESLQDKLATGKQNPVGVIAILNNIFGWNTSRVAHDTSTGTTDNTSIAAQMGLAIEEKS
jgi:hypothetical protein